MGSWKIMAILFPLILVISLADNLFSATGSSPLELNKISPLKFACFGNSCKIEKAVTDGKMTAEQAAPQLEAMKKNEIYIKASIPVFAILGTLLVVFAFAGILKLASMAVGTENTYSQLA